MDDTKAQYVLRYYGHLMTTQERVAHRHLEATAKATHGRTDTAAQTEVRNSQRILRELLSDDPEILQLTADGLEQFMSRTSQRILEEHQDTIVFNNCPRCGAQLEHRKPVNADSADSTGTPSIRSSINLRLKFEARKDEQDHPLRNPDCDWGHRVSDLNEEQLSLCYSEFRAPPDSCRAAPEDQSHA